MELGTIGSMKQLGVTESYKLKRQVVLSASEAAEMIIRWVFIGPVQALTYFIFLASTTSYGPRHGGARRFRRA
jgi:hypothetical protein